MWNANCVCVKCAFGTWNKCFAFMKYTTMSYVIAWNILSNSPFCHFDLAEKSQSCHCRATRRFLGLARNDNGSDGQKEKNYLHRTLQRVRFERKCLECYFQYSAHCSNILMSQGEFISPPADNICRVSELTWGEGAQLLIYYAEAV